MRQPRRRLEDHETSCNTFVKVHRVSVSETTSLPNRASPSEAGAGHGGFRCFSERSGRTRWPRWRSGALGHAHFGRRRSLRRAVAGPLGLEPEAAVLERATMPRLVGKHVPLSETGVTGVSQDRRVRRMSFMSRTRCRASVGLGSNSGTRCK